MSPSVKIRNSSDTGPSSVMLVLKYSGWFTIPFMGTSSGLFGIVGFHLGGRELMIDWAFLKHL